MDVSVRILEIQNKRCNSKVHAKKFKQFQQGNSKNIIQLDTRRTSPEPELDKVPSVNTILK